MTPKQIAHDIIEQENVYLAQAYQLAQAYLQLESRIQKLEAVAEAGQKLLHYRPIVKVSGGSECTAHLKTVMQLREALAELEQE